MENGNIIIDRFRWRTVMPEIYKPGAAAEIEMENG